MKGWGPKSSVCPSKPRESNFFGGISRDFAGISRKRPKSLRKKCLGSTLVLRPQQGLLGGPFRSRLNNPPWIFNSLSLSKSLFGEWPPRGCLNHSKRGPPKVIFFVLLCWSQKWHVPEFSITGLCRGSGGSQLSSFLNSMRTTGPSTSN